MTAGENWQTIGHVDDFAEQDLAVRAAGGAAVIVVKRHGRIFVYEDRCPHVDYPLSVGHLEGDEIVCTWHGACFAVETGEVRCPPSERPLYAVTTRIAPDGRVDVDLDSIAS